MASIWALSILLRVWSQTFPSFEYLPVLDIQIFNFADSSKWIADGLTAHEQVRVENSSVDQIWYLERACYGIHWSFHVGQNETQLYLTYHYDDDTVTVERLGPNINRFFRLQLSVNGKLFIKTREGDRFLCKKYSFLALCPANASTDDIEWDIQTNGVSVSDTFTSPIEECYNPASKWITADPSDLVPVTVDRTTNTETWTLTKALNSSSPSQWKIYITSDGTDYYASYDTGENSQPGVYFHEAGTPGNIFGFVVEQCTYFHRLPSASNPDQTTVSADGDELDFVEEYSGTMWKVLEPHYVYDGVDFFPPYNKLSLYSETCI